MWSLRAAQGVSAVCDRSRLPGIPHILRAWHIAVAAHIRLEARFKPQLTMVTRLITAAVGVAIALVVLFLHNTFLFPIIVGIVNFMLCYEFMKVNRLLKYRLSAVAVFVYALALPNLTLGMISRFRMMLTVACVTVVLFDYIRHQTKMSIRSFFSIIGSMLLIPISLTTAVTLNNSHEYHGLAYLVLALGGAWIADSGAYFTGSAIGRNKLCPTISPNKTVEGFIGGIVADVIFFVLFNMAYSAISASKGISFQVHWGSTVILAMACAVLGTAGDLTASVLKRQLDIKDYSNIMPGHGGLLDRFDSVLLVMPFFTAYVQATSYFAIN